MTQKYVNVKFNKEGNFYGVNKEAYFILLTYISKSQALSQKT